eukprot:gnl/Spiro4/1943_TR920_c0_g1_i1.p1 gnl/Spiro4/1943_TR920_c0_g1~~gnl/Spiro4/1943_TR920_c0_g1_i1.p1  ORF type:complete len:630 (+),score=179.39 gnl/Spiro4/1943_TR920_c0_g1_i1:31-1890(+)
MERLPQDVVERVCSLLTARDLGRVARVNKSWCAVARRDHLWDVFMPLQLRAPPAVAGAPLYVQYAAALTKGDFFPLRIDAAAASRSPPAVTFQHRAQSFGRGRGRGGRRRGAAQLQSTLCLRVGGQGGCDVPFMHLGANQMGNSLETLFSEPTDDASWVIREEGAREPQLSFDSSFGTPVEEDDATAERSSASAAASAAANDLPQVKQLAARLNSELCEHKGPQLAAASAQDLLSSLFPPGDYVVSCYTCVPAHFTPPTTTDYRDYASLLRHCCGACLYRAWCGTPRPQQRDHHHDATTFATCRGDVSSALQHGCDGDTVVSLLEYENTFDLPFNPARSCTSSLRGREPREVRMPCDLSRHPPGAQPLPTQLLETTILFVRCHHRPLDSSRVQHYASLLARGHLPTVLCVTVCDPRPLYFMDRWGRSDDHLVGLFLQTNYILDGHHKLAAAAETGLPVRVVSYCVSGSASSWWRLTSLPTREVMEALTAARCEAHPPYAAPRVVSGRLDPYGPPFFMRMFVPPSTRYSTVRHLLNTCLKNGSDSYDVDPPVTSPDLAVDGMRWDELESTSRCTPADRGFVELVTNSKHVLATLESRDGFSFAGSEFGTQFCTYVPSREQ